MDNFERDNTEPLADDMDPDMEEGMEPFILTDEDGNEVPFEMLGDIEFEGAHYAVMSPLEDEPGDFGDLEEDTQPVVILRMEESDDDVVLESVTDEDLMERVFDAFMQAHPEIFED